jgi:CHAT domain/SIR2-like domain
MAAAFADLELSLTWNSSRKAFRAGLHFTNASNVDQVDSASSLEIDRDELRKLVNDEQAYGAALTDMVFKPKEVRSFYTLAVAAAQATPVHFRLRIEGAPEYHGVRWELLRDPNSPEHAVATSHHMLFSRYLGSKDWRPVEMRELRNPRALIVIANPANLGEWSPGGRELQPVDVEAELARAQAALADYRTEVLAEPGGKDNAPSMDNLIRRLADGFDVLYLVAHGALHNEKPLIFLEEENGTVTDPDAARLIARVRDLKQPPSVVFLSSCQSAGTESADGGALAALGPKLSEAGVPAVIAMQGNITMRTASDFAPAFFESFRQDGIVDQAVAEARGRIRDRQDWWMPVLFSRLRWGQTRYLSEFSDAVSAAGAWGNLTAMIDSDPPRLTPVLGPGLADGIVGSRQEIALRWVRSWNMPIAEHAQGDLARVAQYLRVVSSPGRVSVELQRYLRAELAEHRRNAQGADPFAKLDGLAENERPEKVIEAVGKVLRDRDEGDPYRVVAALPAAVFVTTGWTDLLQDALRARGKVPVTRSFRWIGDGKDRPRRRTLLPAPAVDSPLVYHLFGRLDDPDSLVLTQDDYFEWLTAWIGRRSDIPGPVMTALTNNTLLFLGYRLDDSDFRVVFQSIKSFGGGINTRRLQHIGVQLKPENQMIEPEAAQRYLDSYLKEDRVDIYWADTRAFLDELRLHTPGITT